MRRALGFLLVVLMAVGCGESGGGGGGGAGGGGGEIPPISKVWFGTGLDPGNFGVTGRAGALKQGTPMFTVGNLFSARNPEDVSVTVSTGGSVRLTLPTSGGAGNVYAADLTGAKLGPATYIVSFVDKRGSILASGNLNVTP
jgi:hypothetical protein